MRKMNITLYKTAFVVFAFLMMSNNVLAVKLSGYVYDYSNGQSLPGAKIVLEKLNTSVTTNADGYFVLNNIVPGNYEVIVFQFGYEKMQLHLNLEKDCDTLIRLKSIEHELDPFEVKADPEQRFSVTRLNPVEGTAIYAGKKNEVVLMDKIDANLATNNSRQIYARVAGLNIWESDGAGLQLGIGGRGLSPNRTSNFNTRQNGYDISADALGYPESYYTPASEALDRIEVIRGASSLQYGTQFGGVVNFVMKRGTRLKALELTSRNTVGSFGLFNSFTSIGGMKKRWNYYAAYQFKHGDGWRENSGFTQHNVFSSVQFTLTENIVLSADYTYMTYLAQQPGGLTDAMFNKDPRQSIRERNWFNVNWNLFSLSSSIRINSKTQINIRNFALVADRKSLGFLGSMTKTDPLTERDLIYGAFRNIGNETRFLHRYKLKKNMGVFLAGFRLYAGETHNRQGQSNAGYAATFTFNNPGDLEGSDYLFPSRNIALFAENIFYVTEKFTLTPGIRSEYIATSSKGYFKQVATDFAGNVIYEENIYTRTSRNRWVFLGGLGLSYKTKKAGELYGNISQNYRAINFSDLQIVNPNFKVDPDILDEYGYTADGGLRGVLKDFFTYDVSVFYINYRNRIGELLLSDPQTLQIYRYRTNIGDSYNAGVESFFEVNLFKAFNDSAKNSLSVFVNSSFIDARYLESENTAISNKRVELVPQLTFRSGISFRTKTISVSGQFSYVSEQYTDATNSVFSPTAVSGKVPAYYVIDFSCSYLYKWFKLECGVNNVLDRSYFTRRASGYPGPGILPSDGRNFYVTLQVRI